MNLDIQLSAPHLFINNRKLDVAPQARDLGILVSDSLSPTAHVFDTVSKTHRCAKLILHAFTSQDIGSHVAQLCYSVIGDKPFLWSKLKFNPP